MVEHRCLPPPSQVGCSAFKIIPYCLYLVFILCGVWFLLRRSGREADSWLVGHDLLLNPQACSPRLSCHPLPAIPGESQVGAAQVPITRGIP